MSAAVIDVLRALAYTDDVRVREPRRRRVPDRDGDDRPQDRRVPALVLGISYLLGAVLLIAVTFIDWAILVLPAWVSVVSVFILLRGAVAAAIAA